MLRRAHDRSADAFASRRQRPSKSSGVDHMTKRFSQRRPKIAEGMGFFPVNVFADATGKNHCVVVFLSLQCRREPELFTRGRRLLVAGERTYGPGHVVWHAFELRPGHAIANLPLESNLMGQELATRLEYRNSAKVVSGD